MQLDNHKSSAELSPELLEAQSRLMHLRSQLGIVPQSRLGPPWEDAEALPSINWMVRNAQIALQEKRLQCGMLRQAVDSRANLELSQGEPQQASNLSATTTAQGQGLRTVVVHPTLLLSILKEKLEAPGRVWLLLRAIDSQGRGWLVLEDVRHLLTAKDSAWRICGWRRLRQLLHQGEDVFWERDKKDRLWLKGAHRIAYTLNSGRLKGFPVELPVGELLSGIQATRAAFYASFHGGRDQKPISRQTLTEVTGIAERTQRSYDRVARVRRQLNIAVGERYTQEKAQERAWTQGRGVFRFVDTNGLQGRERQEYIAWHLPNSYAVHYHHRSRGMRKRLNRKLADLLKKGIAGNSEDAVKKVFFPTGALAARAYNRDPYSDAYWQYSKTRPGGQIWRTIPRCSKE